MVISRSYTIDETMISSAMMVAASVKGAIVLNRSGR